MFIIWKIRFLLNGFDPRQVGIGGSGGGGDSPDPPPPVKPQETAQDVLEAQIATNPAAAESAFNVLTNPQFGLGPTTQAFEDVRRDVFPEETAVRSQLLQNILGNLISPTGASPEQQASVEAIRSRESGRLSRNIQQSANLGGGLFGGRRQQREDRAQGELSQAFASEDIARDERNRLNSIQAALPALQILFPELGLVPPQFQSPVASGNAALQVAGQGRGQDISAQQTARARQSALQSSLFGGLGTAFGGFLGRER